MGTRHLIAVKIDGEYKIAQYGQWDGYPTSQGKRVLDFLSQWDRAAFEAKLRAASWLSKEDGEVINNQISEQGHIEKNGKMVHWKEVWPELSRDTGAGILHLVNDAPAGIKLRNSLDFAADSLFCEWAYVIDLDLNTFEVFRGFNTSPLDESERFYGLSTDDGSDGYYQVRGVGRYSLDALPSCEQMVKECDPPDEDEDE